jgi:hypothetical protein
MDRIDVKTTKNQLRQKFVQGMDTLKKIPDALMKAVTDYLKSRGRESIALGFLIFPKIYVIQCLRISLSVFKISVKISIAL